MDDALMSITTDTRNLYRWRTRRTRWLHDWVKPIRPFNQSDTPTRLSNWIMLLSGLYMAGQLVRWAL